MLLVVHTSLDPVTSFFILPVTSKGQALFVVKAGRNNDDYLKMVRPFIDTVLKIDFEDIMQKLEQIQMPAGYERELIIIGNHAYSVVEKIQQFLGKKQVSKEISKVGNIPEGIFFAEKYAPRILSEDGKILAVEFLKRTDQSDIKVDVKTKREQLKNQIKRQLESK